MNVDDLRDMQLAIAQHMLRTGQQPLGRVVELHVHIKAKCAFVNMHERADLRGRV